MCGRFYINGETSREGQFGTSTLTFNLENNKDIRPTNSITTLMHDANGIVTKQLDWGIKPKWSKKLLINAQVETANEKPTWKTAFNLRRCVIPLDGWYEWRQEGQSKVRYGFSHRQAQTMYMAGLHFPASEPLANGALVTLTVFPNKKCQAYHHRQPLIITPDCVNTWLGFNVSNLAPLLMPLSSEDIVVNQY